MKRTSIAIVEDELIVATDLKRRLERIGYEVAAVIMSGEEAVRFFSTASVDLLLMDIHLQGELDGVETVRQIHQKIDVPVVFLTASSDAATLGRAQALDPVGYIVKPFREDELRLNLPLALRNHQIRTGLSLQLQALRETLAPPGSVAGPDAAVGGLDLPGPEGPSSGQTV